MKNLMGSAINTFVMETSKSGTCGARACGELVLTASEMNYEMGATGNLERRGTTETFRCFTDAKGFDDLAKQLSGFADELRSLEKRTVIEPEDPDGDKS